MDVTGEQGTRRAMQARRTHRHLAGAFSLDTRLESRDPDLGSV